MFWRSVEAHLGCIKRTSPPVEGDRPLVPSRRLPFHPIRAASECMVGRRAKQLGAEPEPAGILAHEQAVEIRPAPGTP